MVSILSVARADTYDGPGACELPLTGAVIRYREEDHVGGGAGRLDDIGLGLVLEGEYAAWAELLDLGSGRIYDVDLSSALIVLEWAEGTNLDLARSLVCRPGTAEEWRGAPSPTLLEYSQELAFAVLRRTGFGGLTRPVLLRIAFRDIVRDLDLNDHTAIRLLVAPGDPVLIRLDYDANALVVRRRGADLDPGFERSLLAAFPTSDARRATVAGAIEYRLRYLVPARLAELQGQMIEIRRGLMSLLARYEPERFRVVRSTVETFRPRDTLQRLAALPEAAAAEWADEEPERSGTHG